jgi:hypothetical protein
MTSDQTAAIYAQLGGQDNADTEQNVTRYYTTVPSVDLDVALQAQAACMRESTTRGGVVSGTRCNRTGSRGRFIRSVVPAHSEDEPGYVRRHAVHSGSIGYQELL